MQPRASWMEKVAKEDPQYCDRETVIQHDQEELSGYQLENLMRYYNQSEGLHTWQKMYGCELRADGSKEGFLRFGYDGRTFNKETLARGAPDSQAQIIQRKSDDPSQLSLVQNPYPKKICIEWLEEYLSYGKETLLRTEPPVVTVSNRTEVADENETLVCRVDGFYPREIDASWRRDGEEWLEDTIHGSVAPNADGTYHYWLSIQIDPTERGRYRCHVEHDGLQEPLDVALNEVGEAAGTNP